MGHISRECQVFCRDERTAKVSSTERTFPVVVMRSPEIETSIVEGSVGEAGYSMLVDTGSAVALAHEKFMRNSKNL
ncbi:hypothetical protein T07_12165 [Trichinella nelsoni]|uniref:Uncharacterized protein n=1 Tax=Trichinella nelsoni TaxID=6336 RepID=A0A0V0RSB7_9BILA|nr:hypothetical protein T07_12165 [Trichinella nelsoni]